MAEVTELRVAMTADDFGGAVAFYRDALGLAQAPTGAPTRAGSSFSRPGGRLSTLDEGQADTVDRIGVGRRLT